MNKQTAAEWLVLQIVEDQTIKAKSMSEWGKIFDQAKAMEREQIINAHLTGLIYSLDMPASEQSVQYYNETYK